jgi:hypothetical protein
VVDYGCRVGWSSFRSGLFNEAIRDSEGFRALSLFGGMSSNQADDPSISVVATLCQQRYRESAPWTMLVR